MCHYKNQPTGWVTSYFTPLRIAPAQYVNSLAPISPFWWPVTSQGERGQAKESVIFDVYKYRQSGWVEFHTELNGMWKPFPTHTKKVNTILFAVPFDGGGVGQLTEELG